MFLRFRSRSSLVVVVVMLLSFCLLRRRLRRLPWSFAAVGGQRANNASKRSSRGMFLGVVLWWVMGHSGIEIQGVCCWALWLLLVVEVSVGRWLAGAL